MQELKLRHGDFAPPALRHGVLKAYTFIKKSFTHIAPIMYGNNQPFISISKEKYHYEVKCCVYKYIDTERIYNNGL